MSGTITLVAGKPINPAALYHDGSTARIRAMEVGDFIDFEVNAKNSVRVMAQRCKGLFVTRRVHVHGRPVLRVWRLM